MSGHAAPPPRAGRRAPEAAGIRHGGAWAADEPYAGALRAGRGPLFLRRADGWLLPLEVERWCANADAVDLDVLGRCEGAVLDVGCGPGRLVAALAARGRPVLGLDVSEAAVAHTLRRLPSAPRPANAGAPGPDADGTPPPDGAARVRSGRADGRPSPPGTAIPALARTPSASPRRPAAVPHPARRATGTDPGAAPRPGDGRAARAAYAVCRSVFSPLPDEGRWGTALLLDGNIGIGGDPGALLDRLARVLVPGGLVLAETAPVDVDERLTVRLTDAGGGAGRPFPWARLGTPALVRRAVFAGWRADAQWSAGGRCFVALRARHTSTTAEPPKRAALISSQRVAKPSAGSPAASR